MRVTREKYKEIQETNDKYVQKALTSCVLDAGKIGPNTTFPSSVMMRQRERRTHNGRSRREAKEVMCKTVKDLMVKHDIHPSDVDILIVNCSLFCPTPSLASMIIKSSTFDILSYNLGGMGCSAGVISIDLAKRLLQGSITMAQRRSLFRRRILLKIGTVGMKNLCYYQTACFDKAAAILLSNSPKSAKLELVLYTNAPWATRGIRMHLPCQDADGNQGVRLSRQVMRIAGEALTQNIVNLGPLVLPWSEQIRFFLNVIARKIVNRRSSEGPRKGIFAYTTPCTDWFFNAPAGIGNVFKYFCGGVDNVHTVGADHTIDPYVPNFESCFDHFWYMLVVALC